MTLDQLSHWLTTDWWGGFIIGALFARNFLTEL